MDVDDQQRGSPVMTAAAAARGTTGRAAGMSCAHLAAPHSRLALALGADPDHVPGKPTALQGANDQGGTDRAATGRGREPSRPWKAVR